MSITARKTLRWLVRTPGQTLALSPLAVIAVELVLRRGNVFAPWGMFAARMGLVSPILPLPSASSAPLRWKLEKASQCSDMTNRSVRLTFSYSGKPIKE